MPNQKFITLSILLSFVYILTFGVQMSMPTDDMGKMSDCPFSDVEVLCQMSVFEHLARFQQAFLGMPIKTIILSLLLVLFGLFLSDNQTRAAIQKSRLLSLKRLRNFHPILSDFTLALSDGIVQPKLFA